MDICVKQIIKGKLHFVSKIVWDHKNDLFVQITVEAHIRFLKQNTFLTYCWNIGTDNWDVNKNLQ